MKYLLVIFALLLPSLSNAVLTCVDMPSLSSAEKTSVNYDGSVYYSKPTVFAAGSFHPIYADGYSRIGFCKLVGKVYVASDQGLSVEAEGLLAALQPDSKLSDLWTPSNGRYSMTWIICR